MRKILLWTLVLLLVSLSGATITAAPGGCTTSPSLTPYAFEQIVVSSTALGFTAATYAPSGGALPAMAVVSVETNAIRYRTDGVNPTAAVGMPADAASTLTVCGQQSMRNIRFIRQTADATISVDYYKEGN